MRRHFAAVFLVITCGLSAQTPSELLGKARLFADAPTVHATIEMSLALKEGAKNRTLELFLAKGPNGAFKMLAKVKSPEFLRNLKMLKLHDAAGHEETWLRSSQGTRRVAEGAGDESLFDSDFSVDDLAGFVPERFRVTSMENGPDPSLHWIQAEPLVASPWKTIRIGIQRDTMLIARIDYVDKAGNLGKRYRMIESQTVAGLPSTRSCVMENPTRHSSTTLTVTELVLDSPIADSVFSKGAL